MVTSVTNLGRSGLSDWMIQRITGVILLAYTLFIAAVLFIVAPEFTEWKSSVRPDLGEGVQSRSGIIGCSSRLDRAVVRVNGLSRDARFNDQAGACSRRSSKSPALVFSSC